MKKNIFFILVLLLFVFVGCNKKEVIEGTINQEMTYNEIAFKVTDNNSFEWLVDTGKGYNAVVSYGNDNKALLVNVSMNTGKTSISNSNFKLHVGEENNVEKYEALPTEFKFHKKHDILDFNEEQNGVLEGNLIFVVNEEELENNKFKLVANFEEVTFEVSLDINISEPKIYGLGDSVIIDDNYEVSFKKVEAITQNVKHKGSKMALGNNKLLVIDTEIKPLNGQRVTIKPEDLFFIDASDKIHMVVSAEYDGLNQLVNVSLTEKTDGHLALLIPRGISPEDLRVFIKTNFSETEFTLDQQEY